MTRKKLLPKHHTGKLAHRQHTSYDALISILLITFLVLFTVTRSVVSAAPTDPVEGQYGTYAVVPGPIPTTSPLITNVADNAVFTSADPVTLNGTCPDNTMIKVFKNDVFAGSAFCQSGRFSIDIDLFLGSNALVLRAYNANDKPGPESTPINVRQEVLGATSQDAGSPTTINNQFFITSETNYKGVGINEPISWPITIVGGQAPYALSVSWGDDKTDVISRAQAGTFEIKHTYDRPNDAYKGSYNVTITAADQMDDKAFLQLVTIIGGEDASVASTISKGYNWSSTLRIAWQLLLVAILLIFSFWLGERREKVILRRTAGRAV
jgi:hypothetical protein